MTYDILNIYVGDLKEPQLQKAELGFLNCVYCYTKVAYISSYV